MFDSIDPKQSFPELEHGILKYWREEDTFKRSLKKRENGEIFNFYDGPPFATGLPHYGHILAGTIKDVIPRYQTMRGKYVRRRFGWDCHGLPVENEIEKEQNLLSKRDIEAMGVEAFNALCRAAVQRYTKEWRTTVERLGRWVDMDWDYRTMDPEYMESIWWVFKQLYEKGLVYEGHKPMHICPRCQTPLSNFEVTQGYKDVTDLAVTAMFELEETANARDGKIFVLAWTTTAWTLPGNVFLAVKPDIDYVKFKYGFDGSMFIASKNAYEKLAHSFSPRTKEGQYFQVQLFDEMKGEELIGKEYKPLFPYFAEKYKDKAFRIVEGDFVTTEDGTGVVHIAPGFGEDDFHVGKREKVEMLQHVGMDGKFTAEVKDFAGLSVKPKDEPTATDRKVSDWLKAQGTLFARESFTHSYPHCWRCDSPLLNYATSSWFVAVEKIKGDMGSANKQTTWVPAHLRDGRFGKWLDGARDWAISRSRYWGTPIPIWRDEVTGAIEVLGSRDELMAKSGDRFTKITVARHAESEGNVSMVYQGKVPGTDLTENGQKQAEQTAAFLTAKNDVLPVTIVYTSPFKRTKRTAEAIAKATGAEVRVDERLSEVEFGEYEGKHIDFDDLTFVRERRLHKMAEDQVESIYHFPGMEKWNEIEVRVQSFLDEILPKHRGQHILIITHADLIMNFTHLFTGEDKNKIVHQPYPGLGSVRTFYWDHMKEREMDLHKEVVDKIEWSLAKKASAKTTAHIGLVRHGETSWNKDGKLQGGEADPPLNATGKMQARKLAEKLKDEPPYDLIISSSLKRAVQTAGILSEKLAVPFTEQWSELNERMVGVWSGEIIDDLFRKYPNKIVADAKTTTFHPEMPPGGEGFAAFIERNRRAAQRMLKQFAGKRVLVVAHGGTVRAMRAAIDRMSYEEIVKSIPGNAELATFTLSPTMQRVPEVLDCWFESGSMPYAQEHYPFERDNAVLSAPPGFPADFIAEGLDQTRGWFYTLMVVSSALHKVPAFKHCVVNGIVLAEDGKKMSKRLKNYPEPTEVVEQHGADAVRLALMRSPAVRGDELKFSEKLVEETVRTVLLPLWNAYRLFITYANAAGWKPSLDFSLRSATSTDTLDRWILSKTQLLVNDMTREIDAYDLSATCDHLARSIDDLTNWYVRLSRRRFAGKAEREAGTDQPSRSEYSNQQISADRHHPSTDPALRPASQANAFDTLYRILVTQSQLLAPFCPFITEAMYLNLVGDDHGSVHLSEWPMVKPIGEDDRKILLLMDNTRIVVQLGLSLRATAKIPVRTPLSSVSFALPPSDTVGVLGNVIAEELNVKDVREVKDASNLAKRTVAIDARKLGPRLGSKVQDIIRAAKSGAFEEKDGKLIVLGEELSPEEATMTYASAEGQPSPSGLRPASRNVASDHGIVVSLDTEVTEKLKTEGLARELVREIQKLRKEAGLEFTDVIKIAINGADELLATHKDLVLAETRSELKENAGKAEKIELDGKKVTVKFEKK